MWPQTAKLWVQSLFVLTRHTHAYDRRRSRRCAPRRSTPCGTSRGPRDPRTYEWLKPCPRAWCCPCTPCRSHDPHSECFQSKPELESSTARSYFQPARPQLVLVLSTSTRAQKKSNLSSKEKWCLPTKFGDDRRRSANQSLNRWTDRQTDRRTHALYVIDRDRSIMKSRPHCMNALPHQEEPHSFYTSASPTSASGSG